MLLLVAATAISTWQAMRATAERDEKEEARREAVESEERAVQAAEAERKAKELAGRRLGQIEKANEVLASMFGDLDPDDGGEGGADTAGAIEPAPRWGLRRSWTGWSSTTRWPWPDSKCTLGKTLRLRWAILARRSGC